MGLLDDAIREHLELKRRGGADPSLVAREEHEALAPVPRDDPHGLDSDGQAGLDAAVDPLSVEPSEPELVSAYEPVSAQEAVAEPDPVSAHEVAHEPAHAGQAAAAIPTLSEETQELDMVAVMADDPAAEGDGSSPTWSLAERLKAAEDGDEEPVYGSLDWDGDPEGDQRQAGPEEVPGQERLSFE
jgi:hypothetical protein